MKVKTRFVDNKSNRNGLNTGVENTIFCTPLSQ